MTAASGSPPARATILVVDDEPYVRDSLAALLESRGFRTRSAGSVSEALEDGRLAGVDLVLSDLSMPEAGGLELVRALARAGGPPIVILTAHGTVGSAVDCMRAGAVDYLLKPTDPDELTLKLDRVLTRTEEHRELEYLRSRTESADARRRLVGSSKAWTKAVGLARTAAPADTSVLLLGESGTGKEMLAGLLHRESPRAERPFVAVNCAAIPDELFESEFFGHRKGAFTGAVSDRDGRFRIAHGGTLFLDEVDSLSPTAQAKVLRVLEEGTFQRVGDSESTLVDVRVVCATNSDLRSRVAEKLFREDLYYRIAVFEIMVPALRDRPGDIAELAAHFARTLAPRLGKAVAPPDEETLELLEAYSWPGNVRELRNVIERALLLEQGERLRPESLPSLVVEGAAEGRPGTLREALAAEERRLILRSLEEADGVKREAARRLGIDERNMGYYLRKHGLRK